MILMHLFTASAVPAYNYSKENGKNRCIRF